MCAGCASPTRAAFAAWLGRCADSNLRDAVRALGRDKRPDPRRALGRGSRPPEADPATTLLSSLAGDEPTAGGQAADEGHDESAAEWRARL